MDPNQLVFDISSDDEPAWEEPKGDDYEWLSDFLGAVDSGFDDPDEVVFVGEFNPCRKSKPSKLTGKDLDDEDECVVLDGDPDKPLEVANDGEDDGDELIFVGQKGEIACRDLPHSRHLCAKFKFSSTPHEKYCELCHCFVCDTRAPCVYWGSGTSNNDHCHATDGAERWNSARKSFRLWKNAPAPVSKFPVASPPMATAQLNNAPRQDIVQSALHPTTQNKVTMPTAQSQVSSNVQNQFSRPNLQNQVLRPMPQNQVSRTNIQNQFSRPILQNQVSRPNLQNQFSSPVPQNQVLRPIPQNQVSRPNLQNQVVRPMPQNQVSGPMVQNQVSRPITIPLGNSMPQNQISRPPIIHSCSSSNRFNAPNIISQPRSQQTQVSEFCSNKNNLQSHPRSVSQHLLGPRNAAIRKDRGHGINKGARFICSNTISKRVNGAVAAAVNRTAYGSSESIAPVHTAQHAQNSAAVTPENDTNPIGWQDMGSGTNPETFMLQSSSQPSMGSVYTNMVPSQPAPYSQPLPQSNDGQCINQFGSYNQPTTNNAIDFEIGMVNSISQSGQQPPIDNGQLQTTLSTNEQLSIRELDDRTRSYFEDDLPDFDFFFGDQSFPEVQDGCMPPEPPEPPEPVSFDTGMRLFDFEPLGMA